VRVAGRLADKVAIVTGAGARGPGVGNGMAAAILFAREGARVLCVDQVPERAQATCDTILAEGGLASTFAADVTRKAQCEAMVAAAVERYGRLDVLHNNVGITMRRDVRAITEEEWDRALTVNLKSMLLTVQAALPALEAAGGGSIINVASIAGLRYLGPHTAYAASKAGIIGLSMSLAGQLGAQRIRVNCIAPGQVWTPLVAETLSPAARESRSKAGLIQDEGTAWDVGWAAVYLASDEARWVTGQVLVVDGGLTVTAREQERAYHTG
jgi:NAD(P)-dependent dehydrogenase (short-subunit alcohol dehydrogenase family)